MPGSAAAGFAALLDHTARVWRRSTARGTLDEEQRTYTTVLESPVTLKRPRSQVGDTGPGLAPIGQQRLYFPAGVDVQATDLVQLLTGPDAPRVLEVDGQPTTPRGHHLEIDCRLWQGDPADLVDAS